MIDLKGINNGLHKHEYEVKVNARRPMCGSWEVKVRRD